MSIFGGVVFFWKKCQFMQKSVSFWANEGILKYMIKSCCASKWGKVTSISLNINFLPKMSILCKKKNEILGKMLNFPLSVYYYWSWSFFCKKKSLFLEKSDILCESLYTLTNCLILVKYYNFFGYVSIFIKAFHLLEYCYFDSKYHILQWYFGQKCHFPRRNTNIEGYFHFSSKWSLFSKIIVSSGHSKFS